MLRSLVLAAVIGSLTSSAFAQTADAPQASATQAPNVRLCTANDITAAWRLVRVFETPTGPWTQDFQARGQQFRYFSKDSMYGEYKSAERAKNRKQLMDMLRTDAAKNVKQYVLGDKGVIFFYENRNATSSMYCGIVQENRPPYRKGDMVLTPTEIKPRRLYLLYRKLGPVRPQNKQQNRKK